MAADIVVTTTLFLLILPFASQVWLNCYLRPNRYFLTKPTSNQMRSIQFLSVTLDDESNFDLPVIFLLQGLQLAWVPVMATCCRSARVGKHPGVAFARWEPSRRQPGGSGGTPDGVTSRLVSPFKRSLMLRRQKLLRTVSEIAPDFDRFTNAVQAERYEAIHGA
jgi:hypothetical protein